MKRGIGVGLRNLRDAFSVQDDSFRMEDDDSKRIAEALGWVSPRGADIKPMRFRVDPHTATLFLGRVELEGTAVK